MDYLNAQGMERRRKMKNGCIDLDGTKMYYVSFGKGSYGG